MEAVRLSVWSYSGRPKLEFTFDEKYVRSALGRLKYRGGESMLGRALNVLDRFGWKRSRQARVQAFIFLFEISDMTLQPLKECETSSTCHNRRQLEGRFSSCCRDAQGQRSSAHICWLKQGQARYADAGYGLTQLVPSLIHRLFEIEAEGKNFPLMIHWQFVPEKAKTIRISWHGAIADVQASYNERVIRTIQQRSPPLTFSHLSPFAIYHFNVNAANTSTRGFEFQLSYDWFKTEHDIGILLDQSWSVGAIDFSRQLDFVKLLSKGVDPQAQKLMVMSYSHKVRMLKTYGQDISILDMAKYESGKRLAGSGAKKIFNLMRKQGKREIPKTILMLKCGPSLDKLEPVLNRLQKLGTRVILISAWPRSSESTYKDNFIHLKFDSMANILNLQPRILKLILEPDEGTDTVTDKKIEDASDIKNDMKAENDKLKSTRTLNKTTLLTTTSPSEKEKYEGDSTIAYNIETTSVMFTESSTESAIKGSLLVTEMVSKILQPTHETTTAKLITTSGSSIIASTFADELKGTLTPSSTDIVSTISSKVTSSSSSRTSIAITPTESSSPQGGINFTSSRAKNSMISNTIESSLEQTTSTGTNTKNITSVESSTKPRIRVTPASKRNLNTTQKISTTSAILSTPIITTSFSAATTTAKSSDTTITRKVPTTLLQSAKITPVRQDSTLLSHTEALDNIAFSQKSLQFSTTSAPPREVSTSRGEEVIQSTTDNSETSKPVTDTSDLESVKKTTAVFIESTASPSMISSISSESKGTTEMIDITEKASAKSITTTLAGTLRSEITSTKIEERSTFRTRPDSSIYEPTKITLSEELTSPHTNLIIIHTDDSILKNSISSDFDDIFVPGKVSIESMDIIDDNEEGSTYGSGTGETESFTTVAFEESSYLSTAFYESTTEGVAVSLTPENYRSQITTIEALDSITTTAHSLK
ncbi:unnamed protein product, partial [Oikopleura dioica]